eukprot:GHVQ01006473.1.p1 GENE.GHVQ01006473.1~~GHVQ01006473.1.p1  ORF type:complete len:183 (-),score=27.00 GHVQ01006473.1:539-1087(-)
MSPNYVIRRDTYLNVSYLNISYTHTHTHTYTHTHALTHIYIDTHLSVLLFYTPHDIAYCAPLLCYVVSHIAQCVCCVLLVSVLFDYDPIVKHYVFLSLYVYSCGCLFWLHMKAVCTAGSAEWHHIIAWHVFVILQCLIVCCTRHTLVCVYLCFMDHTHTHTHTYTHTHTHMHTHTHTHTYNW